MCDFLLLTLFKMYSSKIFVIIILNVVLQIILGIIYIYRLQVPYWFYYAGGECYLCSVWFSFYILTSLSSHAF